MGCVQRDGEVGRQAGRQLSRLISETRVLSHAALFNEPRPRGGKCDRSVRANDSIVWGTQRPGSHCKDEPKMSPLKASSHLSHGGAAIEGPHIVSAGESDGRDHEDPAFPSDNILRITPSRKYQGSWIFRGYALVKADDVGSTLEFMLWASC